MHASTSSSELRTRVERESNVIESTLNYDFHVTSSHRCGLITQWSRNHSSIFTGEKFHRAIFSPALWRARGLSFVTGTVVVTITNLIVLRLIRLIVEIDSKLSRNSCESSIASCAVMRSCDERGEVLQSSFDRCRVRKRELRALFG